MGRLSPAAHDLLNLSLPDETVYHQDQGLLLGIGQAVDLLVEGQQFLVVNPGLGGSGRSPGEFIERDLQDASVNELATVIQMLGRLPCSGSTKG